EVYLPPFTTSYNLSFIHPVYNLRVEVLSYNEKGDIFSLMHSAHINMPSNKPSKTVHKDWINERWVEEGLIDSVDGETIEIKNFWMEGKQEEAEFNRTETIERFDGSSGGHFSSAFLHSSWGKR
ncbi:MAG: hypothetical protein KDK36_21155, partial [Leptospiraceae bacterium]|nr:hypothetical protein [Leptospiraceae bacterium]